MALTQRCAASFAAASRSVFRFPHTLRSACTGISTSPPFSTKEDQPEWTCYTGLINLRGVVHLKGPQVARHVAVAGTAGIDGDVCAETVEMMGQGTVKGSMEANDLLLSGHSVVKGSVRAHTLRVAGHTKVEGSVDAHLVDVSGKCNIKGVVRAHDRFESHGDFRILGGVMAKKISMFCGGRSFTNDVIGNSISIRRAPPSGLITRVLNRLSRIKAARIVGDDVELESTSAFQVTGKSVRIGKSCRVEVVEYSEDVHIEEGRSVRVGSVRKIEPSEQKNAFDECAKRLEPNVPFVAKEIAKLQRSDESGPTVGPS